MAGVDTDEEFVAIDGIVATGDYGVAVAPTTATAALGVTWTDLGLTTAAGVVRSQPVTSTVRRAWQNNVKLRTLVTEAAVRFVFTLVQTNKDTVELFNGVPLVAGSLITDPSREWPTIAFDFDTIDGDNVIREYAPKARVVEVGDRTAVAGDSYGWPITVEAEYDAGIGGYTKQFFSEFAVQAAPTVSAATPASQGAGQFVDIVGTNFATATQVKFGATNAATFVINSDTSIRAWLAPGTAGTANVTVINPGGTSNAQTYTRVV